MRPRTILQPKSQPEDRDSHRLRTRQEGANGSFHNHGGITEMSQDGVQNARAMKKLRALSGALRTRGILRASQEAAPEHLPRERVIVPAPCFLPPVAAAGCPSWARIGVVLLGRMRVRICESACKIGRRSGLGPSDGLRDPPSRVKGDQALRRLPHQTFFGPPPPTKSQQWYRRYGKWSLLLSWAPVVGDPLTVVAGTLREPFRMFLLLVTIAKVGRYLVLAAVTLKVI